MNSPDKRPNPNADCATSTNTNPDINDNCAICPFATKFTVEINRPVVNCQSKNIIHCAFCDSCSIQYVGESERTQQIRFSEHKGYAVNTHLNKATGEHLI